MTSSERTGLAEVKIFHATSCVISAVHAEGGASRMAFVESVVLGETGIGLHSLQCVRDFIVNLKEPPRTTLLLGGKDGQMMMEFVEGMGYYVSAFGRGEIEEWIAYDKSLPGEKVRVNLSGHLDDLPRRTLVSEENALEVAAIFYQDGSRSSKHCWMKSLDLMCH